MKNKQIASMAALIAASLSAAHAQIITSWDFQNPPNPIGVNNSPSPTVGAGVATPLGMNIYPTPNVGVTTADVLNGVAGDTGANGNANLSQIWRVRAQAGANGAANGWSSLAPIGTQGAEFQTSTVGFTGINVSFDWYATTQGEGNLQLAYTTDGVTFHNVPVNIGANTGISLQFNSSSPNTVPGPYLQDNKLANPLGGQDWFQGLTASITDPSAANNPLFAIEMVNASTGADDVSTQGTPLNNTSGNWRFDNVVISGTPVPEPTTLALAGLGGLAVLVAVRRRK